MFNFHKIGFINCYKKKKEIKLMRRNATRHYSQLQTPVPFSKPWSKDR